MIKGPTKIHMYNIAKSQIISCPKNFIFIKLMLYDFLSFKSQVIKYYFFTFNAKMLQNIIIGRKEK